MNTTLAAICSALGVGQSPQPGERRPLMHFSGSRAIK